MKNTSKKQMILSILIIVGIIVFVVSEILSLTFAILLRSGAESVFGEEHVHFVSWFALMSLFLVGSVAIIKWWDERKKAPKFKWSILFNRPFTYVTPNLLFGLFLFLLGIIILIGLLDFVR